MKFLTQVSAVLACTVISSTYASTQANVACTQEEFNIMVEPIKDALEACAKEFGGRAMTPPFNLQDSKTLCTKCPDYIRGFKTVTFPSCATEFDKKSFLGLEDDCKNKLGIEVPPNKLSNSKADSSDKKSSAMSNHMLSSMAIGIVMVVASSLM